MKYLSCVAIVILMFYNIIYSQISGKGLESVSKDKVVYYMVGLHGWAENWPKLKNSIKVKMEEKIQSSGLIAKYADNINTDDRGRIILSINFAKNSVSLTIGYVRKVYYTVEKIKYSISAQTWEKIF